MPRKKSKAVFEGNGPTPQDAYVMVTWEEIRRVLSKSTGKAFGEFKENLRGIDQRLASLEQDAQQPRLAMEADVPADKKACERTEGTLLQLKRSMGIVALQKGSKPTREMIPPDLRLSLVQAMMSW